MQLAALIGETSALPVLEAIQSNDCFELVAIWTTDQTLQSLLRPLHPETSFPEHWDDLLLRKLDGVVVAGTSPQLLTAARQLLQRGVPLLIVTETSTGPAKLFDFMPLWQESPELVSPLFYSGVQTVSQQALQEFSTSTQGTLWKLEFERILDSRELAPACITQALVDQLLLQDLKWICDLAGAPQHVTLQVSGPVDQPAEVTVLLGGDSRPEVRWSLRAQAATASWNLKLIGTQGEVSAKCAGNHLPVLEVNGLSRPLALKNTRTADAARQLLDWQECRSQKIPPQSWTEVIQLAEIGAAARRSLLRRRTIDVHFEEASERSQFKTQMAAMGCGALLWTMFGMMALLTLAGIFDPRDREYRQSAAARFVVSHHEFLPDESALTAQGKERVQEIASRWSSTSPVLLVEEVRGPNSTLNQQREATVLEQLRGAGVRDPEQRTVLRALNGKWFETLMVLAWIAVFSPLAMVLLLQLLIVAARRG